MNYSFLDIENMPVSLWVLLLYIYIYKANIYRDFMLFYIWHAKSVYLCKLYDILKKQKKKL